VVALTVVAAAPTSMFVRALGPPERARREVAAWQRARMLDAVVKEVAEQGYAAVTVADVVARAGVSRRTFYEHFDDRQACFLAAYRTGVELLIGRILETTGEVPDAPWREKLRRGLEAYARELAAEPQFSRTLLIDVQGAGEQAIELREGLFELFVIRFRNLGEQAAAQEPGFVPAPDVFLRALVGGISELVQQHILRHGAETLERLTPDLVRIAETVIEFGGRQA
jgi:AcrR family transcriptional regulator